jgi:hypothetical protein
MGLKKQELAALALTRAAQRLVAAERKMKIAMKARDDAERAFRQAEASLRAELLRAKP